MRSYYKKGFTLIEVAAVVGILSALSVGTYQAVQRGRASHCLNNLRQIHQAVEMFAIDHGTLPEAKLFPSSESDRAGIHNILSRYGARGQVMFCPSIPEQLNTYGTNYLWNSSLNRQIPGSVPASTWMMTEISAASSRVPPPHSRGFNILYVGGNAATGPRVSFPEVRPEPERPVEEERIERQPEVTETPTGPRMIIRAPETVIAGEKNKFTVSLTDSSGRITDMDNTVLQINFSEESARMPGSLEISEPQKEAVFEAVFFKTGRANLRISESRTNLGATQFVNVAPGPFASLQFPGFPETWIAGKEERVLLQAVDEWNNLTAYSGELYIGDAQMQTDYSAPFKIENGTWHGELRLDKTAEDNFLLAAAENVVSRSPLFKVVNGTAENAEMTFKGEPVAGKPFQVKISVRDAFGNICKDHEGDFEIILPAGASIEGNLSFLPEDRGEKNVYIIFYAAGNNTVRIQNEDIRSEKSFFVNPGPLEEYLIRDISEQTAGQHFDIIIRAVDNWGNRIKGFYLKDFSGKISYITRDLTAGMWMETIVIEKAGEHTVQIEDDRGKKGSSNVFTVKAAAPVKMEIEGLPFMLKTKNSYSGIIIYEDRFGNRIDSYTGQFSVNSSEWIKTELISGKMPLEIIIEPLRQGSHQVEITDSLSGFSAVKTFFSVEEE